MNTEKIKKLAKLANERKEKVTHFGRRKADRPLSQCTAKELVEFISKTVPTDKEQGWYVMVNEHCHTIDFIDPITMEIHSIEASKIYYKTEGNND